MDLHGKPMIIRQIERLQRSSMISQLVVATSTDSSDDELVNLLKHVGIEVRRGPLDDVVHRFGVVVDEFNPSTIVRLTADCPLADVSIIDDVIKQHLSSGADYTSNVLEPTFPDGLDVECFTGDAFRILRKTNLSAAEKEHVTLGIYAHPETFTLRSVTQSTNISNLRWTVDVRDDLDFVRVVYRELFDQNPNFGQHEILELLETNPELSRTDKEVTRNSGLNK